MRPRSRRNSCQGKRAYGTWALPLKEARRINRKHDENMAPYSCAWCGAIHCGHVDPAHKSHGRPRDD